MVKLASLRKARDKNGKIYLTGLLGKIRIYIFENTYKEDQDSPDFYLTVNEGEMDKPKPGLKFKPKVKIRKNVLGL